MRLTTTGLAALTDFLRGGGSVTVTLFILDALPVGQVVARVGPHTSGPQHYIQRDSRGDPPLRDHRETIRHLRTSLNASEEMAVIRAIEQIGKGGAG